jgi:hypothetical protein
VTSVPGAYAKNFQFSPASNEIFISLHAELFDGNSHSNDVSVEVLMRSGLTSYGLRAVKVAIFYSFIDNRRRYESATGLNIIRTEPRLVLHGWIIAQ